jgi:hypothetical protein
MSSHAESCPLCQATVWLLMRMGYVESEGLHRTCNTTLHDLCSAYDAIVRIKL